MSSRARSKQAERRPVVATASKLAQEFAALLHARARAVADEVTAGTLFRD